MRLINNEVFEKSDIKELEDHFMLQEASFRKGKSLFVAQKAAAVISRRVGIPIGISPIPEMFTDAYGKFQSYFGFMGTGAIRFNFMITGSEVLQSIDLYSEEDSLTPDQNIDLNGFNIVQTIDQVVDIITGEYLRYEESTNRSGKLHEAVKITDMLMAWFDDNPQDVQDLKDGRYDYHSKAITITTFFQTKYRSGKTLNAGKLTYYVKELSKNGKIQVNTASVPGVTVQVGTPVTATLKDPALQAIYEASFKTGPVIIMENIEADVRLLAQGSKVLPGLLLHGKPGTGKTETVERVLKEEGVKPVKVDQKMGGYTGFINALYQNRKDEIVIFDDNDSVFKDEAMVNLLKKVLDMKPVRRISVINPIKVYGTDIVIDEDFDFESKIIFISNLLTLNSAIEQRLKGVTYTLNWTKEESLALIKDSLYNMYAEITEITDSMRDDVFEFATAALPALSEMDYRSFNYILIFRLAAHEAGRPDSAWQTRAFQMLREYQFK